MARLDPAAVARVLDLEDYQAALYVKLAEQAERQGIPREAIYHFAKYLDRIDWDPILSTSAEAAEILGVDDRSVTRTVSQSPEWMMPFIWARSKTGETVLRLWLTEKVRAFKKVYQPRGHM